MACVMSTVGFQPEMVPSSVAKRNWLGPERLLSATTKSLVPLKTLPVGAAVVPAGLLAGGGIVITGWVPTPAASYCVARPLPLSETTQGPVGLCDSPQELTRFESVSSAT